jgi:SMI1 / KNR4 family (SUKH-1)
MHVKKRLPTASEIAFICKKAFTTVDDALNAARLDIHSPLSTLIDSWISAMSGGALPLRPVRRPPATATDIQKTELRLGFPLPGQVRELYMSTNGLDWIRTAGQPFPFGGHFPPLDQMVLAGHLPVSLSRLSLQHWELHRKEAGEPKVVELFTPGSLTHVLGNPESTFSFADLDRFLALQIPPNSRCLLVAHCEGLGVPKDSVIEVENLIATRYESLSHWLSAHVKVRESVFQK